MSCNLHSGVNGILAGVDPGLLLAPGITSQSPGLLLLCFYLCRSNLDLDIKFQIQKISFLTSPITDPLIRTGREVFLSVGDEKEVNVAEVVM